jgi:hypothetical protein
MFSAWKVLLSGIMFAVERLHGFDCDGSSGVLPSLFHSYINDVVGIVFMSFVVNTPILEIFLTAAFNSAVIVNEQ